MKGVCVRGGGGHYFFASFLWCCIVLENTWMMTPSAHPCGRRSGYKLGEWRIGCSKQHPYETDVHTPFFIAGPGIRPGTRLTELAANIDIARTTPPVGAVMKSATDRTCCCCCCC